MQTKTIMRKISIVLLFSILLSLFSQIAVAADGVSSEEGTANNSSSDAISAEISESNEMDSNADSSLGDGTNESSDDVVSEGFTGNAGLVYGTTQDNHVTLMLKEKMKYSDLRNMLNEDSELSVGRNGVELSDDAFVLTGDNVVINGESSLAEINGDVNSDGVVDTTDYLQIKSYLLENFALDELGILSADTDNNGRIDTTDYVQVKAYFLGRFELFPFEKEAVKENLKEKIYLTKCKNDFSFLINFLGSEDEIVDNLSIYQNVDDSEVLVQYLVSVEEAGIYRVSPLTSYENYAIYSVEISDKISFVDYQAKSISFQIGGPDKNNIDYNNDIIYLKKLEESSPGYYPYTIIYDENDEKYILTLSKGEGIDDSFVGKILAVGDYRSEEELYLDVSREIYFGKIQKIYQSGENTVLEMTVPELDEIFDVLDIFFNHCEESPDTVIDVEGLEEEMLGAIMGNQSFIECVVATNLTAQEYAIEQGLVAVDIVGKSFKDYFDFKLTKKEIKSNDKGYITVNLKGELTCTIPLKNSSGTSVGNIKITCGTGVNGSISWVPTMSLELGYFSVDIITKLTNELQIKLAVSANASLNDEMHYYVNRVTGTIHTGTCRMVEKVIDVTHLDIYTEEALLKKYANKDQMKKDECQLCKAVTGLIGTTYVLSSTGVVHCLNCMHVGTINDGNFVKIHPSSISPYTPCKTCRPQDRVDKDFEQRVLNRLKSGDWSEEFTKLSSLFQSSGSSDSGKGMNLLTIPFDFKIAKAMITLELVCDFKLEGSLNFERKTYAEDEYSLWISVLGSSFNKENKKTETENSVEVVGKVDLKLGFNINATLGFFFSKTDNLYLNLGAGAYSTLTGVLHTENGDNAEANNSYGAYFASGLYFNVDCGYDIWIAKGKLLSDEKRKAIIERGYNRVYYSFDNYDPTYIISKSHQSIKDADFFGVEYLDLSNLSKKTEKLNPDGTSFYEVKYVFKNPDGTVNPYLSYSQGGIITSIDAPKEFTAVLEITVISKSPRITNLEQFMTTEHEGTSAIFFLSTLSVNLSINIVDPLKVGDTIMLGTYEQNNFHSNGVEPIEWEVLAMKDGKALVVSKYALDCQRYHDADVAVTWETSALRSWLNNEFYNTAFKDNEKLKIRNTTLVNDDNSYYGTEGGNNTTDKVFILSVAEAAKYYAPEANVSLNYVNTNGKASCPPTRYAKAKGAEVGTNGGSWWWLRSPGHDYYCAAAVADDGIVFMDGCYSMYVGYTVRPAMWIYLGAGRNDPKDSVEKGDILTLGTYEQDNNLANGPEPIEWQVLAVKDGKALMLSKYVLIQKAKHDSFDGTITWENCTLRKWLNNDFYNSVFSSLEKTKIISVQNTNPNNPSYGTYGGNDTIDRVFILSIPEVNIYLPLAGMRITQATAYSDAHMMSSTVRWMLRTPGLFQDCCTYVNNGDGWLSGAGTSGNAAGNGVRPAVWIDLS